MSNMKLFTSLRCDKLLIQAYEQRLPHAGWNCRNSSPFYMLDFHRDRILRAATHWQWKPAINSLSGDHGLERLATLGSEAVAASDGPLRLRIVIDQDGRVSFEKYPTPEVSLVTLFPARLPPPNEAVLDHDPPKTDPFELLVDGNQTDRSEYTHFKTTKREMYDAARTRAGISPSDRKEVLIVNEATGQIMEGSTTTPYFWRGGRWVTPPVGEMFGWEVGSGGQDGTSRRWALEREMAVEECVSAGDLENGEECWLSNGVRGFFFGKVVL